MLSINQAAIASLALALLMTADCPGFARGRPHPQAHRFAGAPVQHFFGGNKGIHPLGYGINRFNRPIGFSPSPLKRPWQTHNKNLPTLSGKQSNLAMEELTLSHASLRLP